MTPAAAWRVPGLSSIRARMVLLILAAAVPLLAMALAITWQNYDMAFHQAREQVQLMRASDVARHQAAVVGVRQVLGALVAAPTVAGRVGAPDIHGGTADQACIALMQEVRMLHPQRYLAIGVTDGTNATTCQAAGEHVPGGAQWLTEVTRSAWFAAMAAGGQPGTGQLDGSAAPASGQPAVLPIGTPILAGKRFIGAVVTLAEVDWLSDLDPGAGGHAWLIDHSGAAIGTQSGDDAGVAVDASTSLPAQDQYDRLIGQDAVLNGRSRKGVAYAYASTQLDDGLRLLVALPVPAGAAARLTLLIRMLVLGLLTVLGLAAVVIGGHYAMVAPVKRLERAVREWRQGGAFDAGLPQTLPDELRDLAQSFAEASDTLQEREQQLRRALAQQELLMQEIHHRVKNNLQIIASLLNLQSSRIRLPQARAEFRSARDRVRALATLHRYLYANGEVHTINMRSFLAELCGQLFEAMGEVEGERIRLDIAAPELRMLSDQAVPLSLIVTEVVGNALKYAFPDGRRGQITIRLTAGDTMAELLIEDDGVGMPPLAADGAGASLGLGKQLIQGFVRQLRATLEIDESHGTSYLFRVPLQRERTEAAAEPAGA